MKSILSRIVLASVTLIIATPMARGQSLQEVHTTADLEALTPSASLLSVLKDGYYNQGDMPATNYIGSTTACSLKSGRGDGGYQIKATGGGCWTASAPVGEWPLQIWGPAANGRTDDTNVIQAALDVCHSNVGASGANSGGKVLLGPYQYLVSSANLVIQGGCVLSAPFWPGLQQGNGTYGSLIYTIVLNPAYTLTSTSGNEVNQGVENIFIISQTQYMAGPPTTYRGALTDISQYSGTAITLGGGQDFLIRNVTMLGFGTCVNVTYNSRPVFDHLYGDCTNGITAADIFDVAKWRDIEIFPALLNYGNTLPTDNLAFTFTSVSNDGGQYCLGGVSSDPNLSPVTGDTVYVVGAGGAIGANGKFTITVNGSGCNPGILLNGSMVAPTPSATVAAGNQWITLNSAPSQWVYWSGQTVTDSEGYIPAGTTIDKIWIGLNLIHVTNAPTTSSSGDTLTIGNPSYTSGGTMNYSLGERSGVGFSITDSTGVPCWNCFAYGHQIGVHLSGTAGHGAVGVIFTAGGLDNNIGLQDPTTTGILIDTQASGAQFVGFNISSYGRAVVVNNSLNANTAPHAFIGGQYLTNMIPGNYQGPSFEFNSAWRSLLSNATPSGDIEIADVVQDIQYGGLNGPNTSVLFQSALGQNKTQQDGASVLKSGGLPVGSPIFHSMTVGLIRQSPTTVGNLSSIDPSPAVGDRAVVTDATLCSFGGVLSGGGSLACPVVYNNAGHWVGG